MSNPNIPTVPIITPVLPPPVPDTFPYYPGVNGPFGDLTSLLAAPPPPPPPPPPPLLPPAVFQDLPRPEPPPMPPLALLAQENWQQSSPVHHPLPARIPSWEQPKETSTTVINGGGSNSKLSSHHSPAPFFQSQDTDLRFV